MDPNRAAADMIEHYLAAEQCQSDLREAYARGMYAPDPVRVGELLEAHGVECSPMRIRAELRASRSSASPRQHRRSEMRDRRRAFSSRQLTLGFQLDA